MIDEIQMMKDKGRGWAWTRTLLGLYKFYLNFVKLNFCFKSMKEEKKKCHNISWIQFKSGTFSRLLCIASSPSGHKTMMV